MTTTPSCDDVESYSKDKFNDLTSDIVISGSSDVWSSDRTTAGQVEHPIVIRPSEDPYFIFGDPNYRLKKQHE